MKEAKRGDQSDAERVLLLHACSGPSPASCCGSSAGRSVVTATVVTATVTTILRRDDSQPEKKKRETFSDLLE